MKKIFLAIGCDIYDYPGLQALNGAQNDAVSIYDHLVTNDGGDYDKERSQLLLSPSISEVQKSIENILFDGDPTVEFTLFFAGHGAVKDGVYFLCIKDSQIDRFSLTALSMTQLFSWLSEAKVSQANIIIDACESGGVLHDIVTLLNPNVIGKTGSLALSILAASSSDEYAQEENGKGVCTAALMSCLRGELIVQTTRPTLDLMEVGKIVSENVRKKGQTPACWGLNLYGTAQFAKNPRYSGGEPHITETLSALTSDIVANQYLRENADKIWELYIAAARGFDVDVFLQVIAPICLRFTENVSISASFIEGIANTFGPRVRENRDPYDEPQLYACCAAIMLKLIEKDASADRITRDLIVRTIESVDKANITLLNQLKDDKYVLLSESTGLSDLYFLPLRLLRVLGWIGGAVHAANFMKMPELLSKDIAKEIVQFIIREYSQSIVAISDEQTPYYVALATACDIMDCKKDVEIISGLLFYSFVESKGRVAASQLTGADALEFLEAKISGDLSAVGDKLARPTTLLSALILVCGSMDMSDVVDPSMKKFDHADINIFVPSTYADFDEEIIEAGMNYSYRIGQSVWNVNDLVKEWNIIRKQIELDSALNCSSVRSAALFSSLLRPNREAWFLLSPI